MRRSDLLQHNWKKALRRNLRLEKLPTANRRILLPARPGFGATRDKTTLKTFRVQ